MLSRYKILVVIFLGFLTPSLHAALPVYDSNGMPLPSLSSMLKRVNPAVVNISTFSVPQGVNDQFFQRFNQALPEQLRQRQRQRQNPKKRQHSAGSGVIIDRNKGLIITNHHVVNNASEVHVALIDGRSFPAKVLGHDPELDISLLQIKADNLNQVSSANSDLLEVGDFAVAIGNPFGLGQTVTTGIISALGRTGLGIEGYENFIQTDASINPGNSGGALVNLQGELIGINTAIIAPSGGNVGIGFAIPINMVNASIKQIQEHGEVKRGRIGVTIQDINIELRKVFNLKNGQQGVLITGVLDRSSAQQSGLQRGDVIISINNKQVKSSGDLRSRIGIKEIGDRIKVGVIRRDQVKYFDVDVSDPNQGKVLAKRHQLLEGMRLEPDNNGQGILIVDMKQNSFAVYSGLRPGDIILGVNRQLIKSLEGLNKALQASGDKILLRINRRGRLFYLVIR